jgi:hypothetical protein
LVAIFIVAIAVFAIIGAVIYFNMNKGANENKSVGPPPAAKPTPTVDADKQRLEDQIANMQKQLDAQKNANRVGSPPTFPAPANQTNPGVVTARVNSPADGFLALRSSPSSDHGDRIAKIPHGSIVTIQNCERDRVKIGSRTGRWCMITWSGYDGWVFDAWLDY